MEVVSVNWICIDERLPSTDARVLVVYKAGPGYCGSGSKSAHFARFVAGQWRFLDLHDKSRLPERVTHWMPVPRLPRGSPKPCLLQKRTDLGAMDSSAGFYPADVGSIPTGRANG